MAPTRTLIVLAVLLAALLFAPSFAATDPPPGAPKGECYSFFFHLRLNFVLAMFHDEGFCCRRGAARGVEQPIVASQFTILSCLLLSMLRLQREEVLPLLWACLPLSQTLQKVLHPGRWLLSEVLLEISRKLGFLRLPYVQ